MTWHRIDAYRNKTGKTLDVVADDLGISKSMLMMVKSGRRNLSGKSLFKLEEAEIAAGLKTRPPRVEAPPLKVPTVGKPAPPDFQSLESRLVAVELGIKEILKLLKEKKR
ncbi:MAG TPA: helix-turn-helix transcriptional regulator [Kiritimatiellia bacterium]|nr:helix-turn-helix transcriptional regulator [Kiritimatiellia bacterium]HMO99638.1 helix-turn-helix transcriptional regulator [Kiritimatiellia bacterium]HMP97115.1 helix-turn-helix transcriptional regulator [Kiritimatiellia bacterium]